MDNGDQQTPYQTGKGNPNLGEILKHYLSKEQPMEWISVNDRLPEFNDKTESTEKVLLATFDKEVGIGTFYKQSTEQVFSAWENSMPAYGITHWMPKPIAP